MIRGIESNLRAESAHDDRGLPLGLASSHDEAWEVRCVTNCVHKIDTSKRVKKDEGRGSRLQAREESGPPSGAVLGGVEDVSCRALRVGKELHVSNHVSMQLTGHARADLRDALDDGLCPDEGEEGLVHAVLGDAGGVRQVRDWNGQLFGSAEGL